MFHIRSMRKHEIWPYFTALGKPRPIRLTESAIEPDYFWALLEKNACAHDQHAYKFND